MHLDNCPTPEAFLLVLLDSVAWAEWKQDTLSDLLQGPALPDDVTQALHQERRALFCLVHLFTGAVETGLLPIESVLTAACKMPGGKAMAVAFEDLLKNHKSCWEKLQPRADFPFSSVMEIMKKEN